MPNPNDRRHPADIAMDPISNWMNVQQTMDLRPLVDYFFEQLREHLVCVERNANNESVAYIYFEKRDA